jgi:hypothetical protein
MLLERLSGVVRSKRDIHGVGFSGIGGRKRARSVAQKIASNLNSDV